MRRTLPFRLLAALLVCATGCVSATRLSLGPPTETSSSVRPRGYLLIVGGGGTTTNMYEKALQLGGEKDAKVVIFPQASELPDTGKSSAAVWVESGVAPENVFVADVKDERTALEHVEAATIIWFPGGVQTNLMKALGNDLRSAIRKRYYEDDHVVVGGTSAGAAVMSSTMITGDYVGETGEEGGLGAVIANKVVTEPGLGLIDWAIVDQHFFKRRRFNRLLSCVLDHREKLIGIGIDERTSILVHDTSFEVIGESGVLVIDARKAGEVKNTEGHPQAASGLKVSLLTSGMKFDITD